jgi:hypothetical protein
MIPQLQRDALHLQYQYLGSLNWLAHTTHPNLSTVISLLAQHQSNPSTGHLDAAKYVVKYLATMKTLGFIYFTSRKCSVFGIIFTFSITLQTLFYQCPMLTGDHKMLPYPKQLLRYHFSFLVQCPLSILIYWGLFTGCPNVNLLWQGAQRKQKSMLLLSVSNFCWNFFKFWNFLKLNIFYALG